MDNTTSKNAGTGTAAKRFRRALEAAGIAFEERGGPCADFLVSTGGRCDGLSIRPVGDTLIVWVQDGWVDARTVSRCGLDGFCSRWTASHPGFSAHLLNPFREDGCAPACKSTHPFPATTRETVELLRERILGDALDTALAFFREIHAQVEQP
jgi:hypothetical protein